MKRQTFAMILIFLSTCMFVKAWKMYDELPRWCEEEDLKIGQEMPVISQRIKVMPEMSPLSLDPEKTVLFFTNTSHLDHSGCKSKVAEQAQQKNYKTINITFAEKFAYPSWGKADYAVDLNNETFESFKIQHTPRLVVVKEGRIAFVSKLNRDIHSLPGDLKKYFVNNAAAEMYEKLTPDDKSHDTEEDITSLAQVSNLGIGTGKGKIIFTNDLVMFWITLIVIGAFLTGYGFFLLRAQED